MIYLIYNDIQHLTLADKLQNDDSVKLDLFDNLRLGILRISAQIKHVFFNTQNMANYH